MGNSYLTKITAPTSLQQVGTEAFENCRALINIKFTSKLLDIYAGAFLNCKNITNITFPYGTRLICEKAFDGCNKLLKIKFPSSVIRIPDNLGTVKNRTIYYYSPFYTGNLGDRSKLAKGLITYAYKGSIAEARLKSEGITVRNYSKPYAIVSKPGKAPSQAIIGTGKPNTSWYNKNITTFKISNPDQLAGLAILVNKGIEFKGKTIQLTKDLNLVHYSNWTAIGKDPMKDGEPIYTFRGTFDGKGHSIYNLRINAIKKRNVGFFGILNGTVKNLKIEDADVLGCSDVGILAGSSTGTINQCHVCGNIRGNDEIGGLVGAASGIISSCYSSATIHGIEKTGVLVGVFVGKGLEGRELKDSSSKGYVSGLYMVGGIVGELSNGTITNCENSSTVKGRLYVGGIIGILGNGDSASNCTNHTPVVGSTDVGGIVGKLEGDKTINECTNLASVTGENNIGGIVGETLIGKLTNSKNEGEITGNSCVGGILGKLGSRYASGDENVLNCENTGSINATRYTGNLIGKEE